MKTLFYRQQDRNACRSRIFQKLLPFFLLGSLFAHTGCSENGTETPEPAKGYATGQVLDGQGKPMAGVLVYVDNTIYFNSGMSATTNAEGRYKIKTEPGSWRTYALVERDYNGAYFKLDLHPDNWDSFAGQDGAVRNFQWKLTGEKPFNRGAYYGGEVQLVQYPNSKKTIPVEEVEFTFTPVGTLIDGSAGTTFSRSCGQPRTKFYSIIHDVPLGRYKITAVHKPTGMKLLVRNGATSNASFGDSANMDFYGHDSPRACTNCMSVEYKEP